MYTDRESATNRFQEIGDPPFLNREFQSYLIRTGFMRRKGIGGKVDEVLDDMMTEMENSQYLSVNGLFLYLLMENKGWIVSNSRLAFAIYEDPLDSITLDRLKGLQNSVSKKIGYDSSEVFMAVPNLGRGIGIEDFELDYTELRILHNLWFQSSVTNLTQRGTRKVRINTLAQNVFGDYSYSTRREVYDYIRELRQKARNKSVHIQSHYSSWVNLSYSLEDTDL